MRRCGPMRGIGAQHDGARALLHVMMLQSLWAGRWRRRSKHACRSSGHGLQIAFSGLNASSERLISVTCFSGACIFLNLIVDLEQLAPSMDCLERIVYFILPCDWSLSRTARVLAVFQAVLAVCYNTGT